MASAWKRCASAVRASEEQGAKNSTHVTRTAMTVADAVLLLRSSCACVTTAMLVPDARIQCRDARTTATGRVSVCDPTMELAMPCTASALVATTDPLVPIDMSAFTTAPIMGSVCVASVSAMLASVVTTAVM